MSVCCINNRFCWEKAEFPSWEHLIDFDKPFCLIPYRGWTPPLLIGDRERYLELWPREDAPRLLASCDGVWNADGKFHVGSGRALKSFTRISDAVNELFLMNGDPLPFVPDAFYRKGNGRLEAILDDPESVAIILCNWRRYRRNGNSFRPVSAEMNRNGIDQGLKLSDTDRMFQQDQESRHPDARFKFLTTAFSLRCGGKSDVIEPHVSPCCDYSLSDYRYDGTCIVLDKSCHTENAIEFLKSSQVERSAQIGLDAIFVKEKEQCYALGCRTDDFFAPADGGFYLREIRNFRERRPFENSKPMAVLFEFLTELHNFGYVQVQGPGVPPRVTVPFIEEELPRGEVLACGSFGGALMFYDPSNPIRRTQWNRIENPLRIEKA